MQVPITHHRTALCVWTLQLNELITCLRILSVSYITRGKQAENIAIKCSDISVFHFY